MQSYNFPGNVRELLGFFRVRPSRTAMVMVDRLQVASRVQSYGSKQVPLIRELLLKAMETLPYGQQRRLADLLFGAITFTSACTGCGGCAGVCPTGAIEPAVESKQPPIFDRQRCVGLAPALLSVASRAYN